MRSAKSSRSNTRSSLLCSCSCVTTRRLGCDKRRRGCWPMFAATILSSFDTPPSHKTNPYFLLSYAQPLSFATLCSTPIFRNPVLNPYLLRILFGSKDLSCQRDPEKHYIYRILESVLSDSKYQKYRLLSHRNIFLDDSFKVDYQHQVTFFYLFDHLLFSYFFTLVLAQSHETQHVSSSERISRTNLQLFLRRILANRL